MKKSMIRALVTGAAVLAVAVLGTLPGGGRAAAQARPGTGTSVLSPYIGKCVGVVVDGGLGVWGELKSVGETEVLLELDGYPIVASTSNMLVALVDVDGGLQLCPAAESAGAVSLLERMNPLGRR